MSLLQAPVSTWADSAEGMDSRFLFSCLPENVCMMCVYVFMFMCMWVHVWVGATVYVWVHMHCMFVHVLPPTLSPPLSSPWCRALPWSLSCLILWSKVSQSIPKLIDLAGLVSYLTPRIPYLSLMRLKLEASCHPNLACTLHGSSHLWVKFSTHWHWTDLCLKSHWNK